ncbi:MAG: hypothetical protein HQL95_07245 [Magnetococcales bacterium]|nr:hypothetical protein [Magnetococcales bacterium]
MNQTSKNPRIRSNPWTLSPPDAPPADTYGQRDLTDLPGFRALLEAPAAPAPTAETTPWFARRETPVRIEPPAPGEPPTETVPPEASFLLLPPPVEPEPDLPVVVALDSGENLVTVQAVVSLPKEEPGDFFTSLVEPEPLPDPPDPAVVTGMPLPPWPEEPCQPEAERWLEAPPMPVEESPMPTVEPPPAVILSALPEVTPPHLLPELPKIRLPEPTGPHPKKKELPRGFVGQWTGGLVILLLLGVTYWMMGGNGAQRQRTPVSPATLVDEKPLPEMLSKAPETVPPLATSAPAPVVEATTTVPGPESGAEPSAKKEELATSSAEPVPPAQGSGKREWSVARILPMEPGKDGAAGAQRVEEALLEPAMPTTVAREVKPGKVVPWEQKRAQAGNHPLAATEPIQRKGRNPAGPAAETRPKMLSEPARAAVASPGPAHSVEIPEPVAGSRGSGGEKVRFVVAYGCFSNAGEVARRQQQIKGKGWPVVVSHYSVDRTLMTCLYGGPFSNPREADQATELFEEKGCMQLPKTPLLPNF